MACWVQAPLSCIGNVAASQHFCRSAQLPAPASRAPPVLPPLPPVALFPPAPPRVGPARRPLAPPPLPPVFPPLRAFAAPPLPALPPVLVLPPHAAASPAPAEATAPITKIALQDAYPMVASLLQVRHLRP